MWKRGGKPQKAWGLKERYDGKQSGFSFSLIYPDLKLKKTATKEGVMGGVGQEKKK